ncbi:MAG: SDR family NAD(P)-dependent oxidoreductase [Acidimicrobiales bacterium]
MLTGGLDNKIALVTGGGSGLGAAFSRRLAADGATVVVNDLDPAAAAAVAAEIGGDSAPFDVTDAAAFDAAVDAAVARHGRLDIVINNAGIAPKPNHDRFAQGLANQHAKLEGRPQDMVPLDVTVSMTDAEWDLMIRTHLYGVFYGCRAALRHMTPARSGSIINIASILGLWPSAGAPSYSAAKAAIIGLTKSVALEVAPFGVRVNAVCPGYVDTPLLAPMDAQMKQLTTMRIGMGRMAQADELAQIIRFLAGDESSYCTGDILSMSGGYA